MVRSQPQGLAKLLHYVEPVHVAYPVGGISSSCGSRAECTRAGASNLPLPPAPALLSTEEDERRHAIRAHPHPPFLAAARGSPSSPRARRAEAGRRGPHPQSPLPSQTEEPPSDPQSHF